ncbi:MAG: oligosaccharide flippase family protein [Ignavibacteriales bacterium]|nr:oligosaccharide flippase family protein [Ignavibacteriales bacterium]MCF8305696.1 oligosaccharide flippase family protein [Ignavibacteriales bacterium]MCF8315418.1 oligosaccharide flippase family protein [Ignavibacteriales bacterium]MCF8438662.1 oligosaccharide flippase family protein [Ignavibacteriales bacterium]
MIEKLKELTKDTAIYGISTIFGRFFGFVLVPFYTNVFDREIFGVYSYLYSILAFLNIAYIYGMDAAYLKFASDARGDLKKDVFSSPFIFVLISSVIMSGLIWLFDGQITASLGLDSEYTRIVFYIALILILDTISLIPFAALRLERKALKFATIKTLNILINLGLNIWLILFLKYGIEAIFISNLFASAFSILALLPEIFRKFEIRIDFSIIKRMLKFGIPYLPASLAAMMVQMIDVPIVRMLEGDTVLGVYRANYKLGIFMMLFVTMFQYAWQPFFLNHAKDKDAKTLFSRVLTLYAVGAAVLWLFISLFIDNIAAIEFFHGKTLVGKSYLSGIYIVPIILLAYYFHGFYINFTAGLYIKEKTNYFPYVTGAGALVNVAVNFTLIPVMGIFGAALATLASYMITAAGLFAFSQRFYPIPYEFPKVLKTLSLVLVFGGAFYYLQFTFGLDVLPKFLIFILFIVLLFLLKVLNISEVRNLLNSIRRGK